MLRDLKNYFEAAALANGKPQRFVTLVAGLKPALLVLHLILITGMLNFPVLFAIAKLEPWELYSRSYGTDFSQMLPPEYSPDSITVDEFNQVMYSLGYGNKVLLPLLGMTLVLVVILQGVFYLCAAFFLGLNRLHADPLSFKTRIGIFIMASTFPVIGSAVFGLWLPAVHIIVFYLAVTLVGCNVSQKYDKPAGEPSNAYPEYADAVLGVKYSPKKTSFKVWAPGAQAVEVLLFEKGDPATDRDPLMQLAMKVEKPGLWTLEIPGDLNHKYYLYRVTRDGKTRQAVDPYARSTGLNGHRGMILDLTETDPPGFREEKRPALASPADAVIYELHIRDLSMDSRGLIQHKGKFLGLTETNTKNSDGLSTGLDHIKELGVTHVHLLPSFDYKTVNESKMDEFNWGYDPQNYNTPEGSYATDPYNGEVRVREFKEMVQALHRRGLGVIMDVVYNHTYSVEDSNFTILAPFYYYRMNENGIYADGSACGNETASERLMMRKFITESVTYWASEYKIDGFRFDLMGLHDIETMNNIREALDKIDPAILMYGEGWTAGPTPLPEAQRAIKANASWLNERIAVFSDDIRDGVKGSAFVREEAGFANGDSNTAAARREDVKFGITGAVRSPAVDIKAVQYSTDFWARAPIQSVNYVSAHDNLSLWDKLTATAANNALRANKLAAAIVLTSQGIPFFQAGEEMARTKLGDENSFRSPDSINRLDWDRKSQYTDLFAYYQGLIRLRRSYGAFRLRRAEELRENLHFLDSAPAVIAYTLENAVLSAAAAVTAYSRFAIIFNGSTEEERVIIPAGEWEVLVNGERAGTEVLGRVSVVGGEGVSVHGKTALVLGKVL